MSARELAEKHRGLTLAEWRALGRLDRGFDCSYATGRELAARGLAESFMREESPRGRTRFVLRYRITAAGLERLAVHRARVAELSARLLAACDESGVLETKRGGRTG